MIQPKYHVCPVKDGEARRFMVAREGDIVEYWDDEQKRWVIFPEGTRFVRMVEAERLKDSFAAA